MSLSAGFIHFLEFKLSTKVLSVNAVSGGSINQVYCLHAEKEKFLIKVNIKDAHPHMFKFESEGLETIGKTAAIAVPGVILQGDFEDKSFLILTWINNRNPTVKSAKLLGEQLGKLHQSSATNFGLSYSNYMGSLVQSNRQHQTWAAFFVEERLAPQVTMAFESRLLNYADVKNFDLLYKKLSDLFQEEQPSLIHGDLWSGNYLIAEDETPYLIDPAIAYAHRECDIALTTLFGGFLPAFYDAYQESYPLDRGWEQRIALWNIYPLLIHLNLFGRGYYQDIQTNLGQYIR